MTFLIQRRSESCAILIFWSICLFRIVTNDNNITFHLLSSLLAELAPNNFIDTLREHMLKPSLSTVVGENSK